MRHARAVVAGFSMLLAAALAAPLAPAEAQTRFVFANESPYDTMDPHAAFDVGRVAVRLNLYDGLYRWLDNPAVPTRYSSTYFQHIFANSAYDAGIKESWKISDPKLRLEKLRECEKILMEDMPIIPIYYYALTELRNPAIQNAIPNSLGMYSWKDLYLAP